MFSFLFSPSFAVFSEPCPHVQTLKLGGKVGGGVSLGGLKSNLRRVGYCCCGKHLVAICLQSSPSTPGQGHSKIDTGPKEKYKIPQLKNERKAYKNTFAFFILTRDSTMLGLQLRRVLTA